MKIDFNCDLAEGAGCEELIMPIISSANVCCGLHAGGIKEISKTLKLAKKYGVRIGAHVGFDDRDNFGRLDMSLADDELRELMLYQLAGLNEICKINDVKLSYVKPHGAMYNMACKDIKMARVIAKCIKDFDPQLALMGLSNSSLIKAANEFKIASISEVFADRRFGDDGYLLARSKENALITNEDEAVKQVINMIKNSYVISENNLKIPIKADSLCLHGDNKSAIDFAKKIKESLDKEGIKISSI